MLSTLFASLILLANRDGATVDLTSRIESAYQQYVGQRVMVCGSYSPKGKISGYVATRHATAYLIGYPYDEMKEGQRICVTGVLHFQPEGHSNNPLMAAPAAYFYFTKDDSFIRTLEPKPRKASNQALEATADRRENFHRRSSTLFFVAMHSLVGGASAWSR